MTTNVTRPERPVEATDGSDDPFSLALLGGWRLRKGSVVVQVPASEQRLIAFVGLRHHVSRAYAAGTLWGEVSEQHAHGSLRSTIWRLSRSCPGLVDSQAETLQIPDDVAVDVRELRGLFTQMLLWTREDAGTGQHGGSGHHAAVDLGSLPDWLWGDLLPGWNDDWVVLERERLRQMRVHALEAMTRTLAEQGRFSEALELGMAAVAVAPLRESAHREVIRIHLAEGNVAEALRQFEVCTQLLRNELGIKPSALMDDLMRRTLDQGHGNRGRTVSRERTNVPRSRPQPATRRETRWSDGTQPPSG